MTKGSKQPTETFVRLPHRVIDSEAFHGLSANACKLLLGICRRYNGHNNGAVRLSLGDAARWLSCSRSTAIRTFSELSAAGFIVAVERGGFRYRAGGRTGVPTAWRITFLPGSEADVVNL